MCSHVRQNAKSEMKRFSVAIAITCIFLSGCDRTEVVDGQTEKQVTASSGSSIGELNARLVKLSLQVAEMQSHISSLNERIQRLESSVNPNVVRPTTSLPKPDQNKQVIERGQRETSWFLIRIERRDENLGGTFRIGNEHPARKECELAAAQQVVATGTQARVSANEVKLGNRSLTYICVPYEFGKVLPLSLSVLPQTGGDTSATVSPFK